MIKLDNERVLDVMDDLVTQVLGLFGERSLDEKAAQNPG